MIHGGESLIDGRADGAIDQNARQVGVTHQSSADESGPLVSPSHVPAYQRRQPVGPRDALELTPPSRHHQSHVETCSSTGYSSHLTFHLCVTCILTQHKRDGDELSVLITVDGELLEHPPLSVIQHTPVNQTLNVHTGTMIP